MTDAPKEVKSVESKISDEKPVVAQPDTRKPWVTPKLEKLKAGYAQTGGATNADTTTLS